MSTKLVDILSFSKKIRHVQMEKVLSLHKWRGDIDQ